MPKMLPMVQYLEGMHYDFWHYRYFIEKAKSGKEMKRYLNAIHNYKICNVQTNREIRAKIKAVKKCVREMHMHDCTRKELFNAIESLLESMENAIRIRKPDWKIPENYKG